MDDRRLQVQAGIKSRRDKVRGHRNEIDDLLAAIEELQIEEEELTLAIAALETPA